MLHVNEKYFNSHSQLWKDNFRQKNNNFSKCDMTPVNLGKNLEYLKTQESLRSENLIEYYLCKGIFLYVFSTLKDIIEAQSKTDH